MVYQVSNTTYGKLLKIVRGLDEYELSDHNRPEVDMSPERIEVSRRLASGKRRRYYIADKRTFGVEWERLPHTSTRTIDGGIGADELAAMYYDEDNVGELDLVIGLRDGGTETVTVHIVEMTMSITNRYKDAHYYNITMSLEEV